MKDPAVYFEIARAPNALDELAEGWGLARRPGETDFEFRRRIRAQLGNTQRGTAEHIRDAINAVEGVERVRDIVQEYDQQRGMTVIVRVATHQVHSSLRDRIEQAIDMVRPAGVIVELELEREGAAWA